MVFILDFYKNNIMPSKSKSQQRLFSMALAVRKGELKRSDVYKAVLDIVDSDMTDKEIANLDNYEKWQLTRYIQSVFELQIHDAVHQKRDEMSAYDAEKQIKAQIMEALDNPESVEKSLP